MCLQVVPVRGEREFAEGDARFEAAVAPVRRHIERSVRQADGRISAELSLPVVQVGHGERTFDALIKRCC